jgi:hypothetical protein
MKTASLWIATGLLSLSPCAWAANQAQAQALAQSHEIDYRSSIQVSSDPLNTEDFTTLDPGAVNPHLQRWALSRIVRLQGFAPRKIHSRAADTYGVSVSALDTQSTVHLRPEGPWYQSLSEFPCAERTPSMILSPLFATRPGTEIVANAAARLWDEILIDKKKQLQRDLNRVSLSSASLALEAGQRVFKEWLGGVDVQWRERVASELVLAQWQSDRKDAEEQGVCRKGAPPAIIWPDRWQPAAGAAASPSAQPIFRAPARRVEGYFSIRLDLRVGFRNVSGQFLIDPSSPTSVVSPTWLLAQGVSPQWVEIPEAALTPVRVHAGSGSSGLAKMAFFDQITASGYTLGLQRLQIHDVSDLFDEPDSPVPCCSGVLGQDFLSRYVLEFRPGSPMEVLAWPVKGYSLASSPSVELRRVPGPQATEQFKVACSPSVKALGIPKLCQDPVAALRESTAPVIFDVPHGKLWYSKAESQAPIFRNQSGLSLEFGYPELSTGRTRALVVEAIRKTPISEALTQLGLKRGDVIEKIDGITAVQLGSWEVYRHLAGVYGDLVSLAWLDQKTRSSTHATFVPGSPRVATAIK